jgi:hypothetical protein
LNCKGQCPRYVDNNGDVFCDYTTITEILKIQLDQHKELKDTCNHKIIKKDSTKTNLKSNNKPNLVNNNKKYKTTDSSNNNTINTNKNIDKITSGNSNNQQNTKIINDANTPKKKYNSYDLVLVSSITFGLYFLTFFLAKLKKIKTKTHRRIWNLLLLLTFMVSCLFGFFLVVQINFNILFSIFRTILYWHVEIGIAMTLIAVFHILWHLKYFRTYLKAFKLDDKKKH